MSTVQTSLDRVNDFEKFEVNLENSGKAQLLNVLSAIGAPLVGGKMGQMEVQWTTIRTHPNNTDEVKP